MQKEVASALKRKFCGNRSRFARALDYAAFRLLILISAYLFFRARIPSVGTAFLLSFIALLLVSTALSAIREFRFARFLRRERRRVLDGLLLEKCMLMDENTFLQAAAPLMKKGSLPVLVRCAEPAGADLMLSALRCGEGEKTVFSTAGYAPCGRDFAGRHAELTLIEPAALLTAAKDFGFSVEGEAVDRAILSAAQSEKAARVRARQNAFCIGSATRYGAAAVLLFAASFLTRYALYYRLLSGFMGLAAGISAFLFRSGDASKSA